MKRALVPPRQEGQEEDHDGQGAPGLARQLCRIRTGAGAQDWLVCLAGWCAYKLLKTRVKDSQNGSRSNKVLRKNKHVEQQTIKNYSFYSNLEAEKEEADALENFSLFGSPALRIILFRRSHARTERSDR